MTFLAQEQSTSDGRPVELFLFKTALQAFGTGFTNSESPITVSGQLYTPIGIERTEPVYSSESDAGSVTMTVSRTLEFARRFVLAAPSDRYVVTIFRRHLTDGALDTVVWWKGFISQVVFRGLDADIVNRSLLELFTRIGPRMNFQQPCNHVLYDSRCTVVENSFRFQGIPSSISANGLQLTFAGLGSSPPLTDAPAQFQPNFYIGGFIRTPDLVDHRLITGQSGDVLSVQFPFFETPSGLNLDVFAGCDHQIDTCDLKFGNILNHGGHAYLPVRNIYTKGLDSTGVATLPGGGSRTRTIFRSSF